MNNKSSLPTIGLSMIVRNEEKVILRLLKTIHPIISHFTIVDTGSSDKTKAIIKQFMNGKKISGEIYDHKWINYEDARNYALKKSKDKTDFSFVISASNTLNVPPDFDIDNLRNELSNTDIGMMKVNNTNGSIYSQRAFWRNSKKFRYFGATHEILLCDEPAVQKDITGLSVQLHSDGKSWEEGKEKFKKNIKLLSDYIEKNGMEERHVFYLAESYKDAGEPEKAIEWYNKRIEMKNGWHEEAYWSQLMIAGIKWGLNKPISEIADEYMRCGEIDTLRAEHLYHLKRMYERNERPQCAIKIGELLSKYKNPYPKRNLFLNPLAYSDTKIQEVPTKSSFGKWNGWYKNAKDKVPSAFGYGETITYVKASEFLSDMNEVENWGCGMAGFKNHCKTKYIGVDGSNSPFADKIIDICKYTSSVDGIMMRHVLEHNYLWRDALTNALKSFNKKMCLIIFTPFSEETKEIANNKNIGVDVPDISFNKKDITDCFVGCEWREEEYKTKTQYGVEYIFYIEKN